LNTKEAIEEFAGAPLNLQLILSMFKDYKRPYDKINELLKQEMLIPLKKGLYIAGSKTKIPQPEPFLIANHLWGPSYVSVESALSYWELIPERVFDICSVTMKSAKKYNTPVGRFIYAPSSPPY
jgi:hypothetical protein